MDYRYVLYEKEGAVVRVTMNRPEKLNAFDFPDQGGILDDFYAALGDAGMVSADLGMDSRPA